MGEKLRHNIDQRNHLALDDGVKVSYGKIDDVLTDVMAITGTNPEEGPGQTTDQRRSRQNHENKVH